MTTLLSPGIEIVEKDLSAYISRAATGRAATVGKFQWGPCFEIQQVSDEADLVNRFGLPDDDSYASFYSCTNFLKYANDLRLVRVCDSRDAHSGGTARNSAVPNAMKIDVVDAGAGYEVNDSVVFVYEGNFVRTGTHIVVTIPNHGLSATSGGIHTVYDSENSVPAAVYSVTVIDANKFAFTADDATDASGKIYFVFDDSVSAKITAVGANGEIRSVEVQPATNNHFITRPTPAYIIPLSDAGDAGNLSASFIHSDIDVFIPNDQLAQTEIERVVDTFYPDYMLEYHSIFGRFPGKYGNDITVSIINSADFQNKSIKTIKVIDDSFVFKNNNGIAPSTTQMKRISVNRSVFGNNIPIGSDQYAILVYYKDELVENFVVSTTSGAKDIYGRSIYVDDIFAKGISNFITASASSWPTISCAYKLTGGADGEVTTSDWIDGWNLFDDPDILYVNLLFAGGVCNEDEELTKDVQKHIVENIAGVRRDCLAFISPAISTTMALKPATAVQAALAYRSEIATATATASFGTMDSGQHKQQLDKYNDRKVWIANNADIAGLCAFTDRVAYTWNSPAGLNRGSIRGVIKLAYDAKQSYRDTLYEAQMNPIVHFPTEGYCLWGDKTLQSKPSAFDRINVRRLFNMLEKAIGDAAKYKLFENNTPFTRNSFVTEVSAYLDIIKGQGGVIDYYVWCDDRNNTPAVIDRNEFIGTIFIKPPRSINYLTLNFVATSTGANFEELISQQF